jgi:putative peptidoglycan lipid II flippase
MIRRLSRLWNSEQGLEGAAGLLVITMVLSNALGFLRDLILANFLPLSVLDTYYAAFRLPDFLFNLFILGAISSAFIPVFLDLKTKKSGASAFQLSNNIITIGLTLLIVMGGILWVLMPMILPYFVPGFPPEKVAATVPLARTLLLSPLFFAISYIFGGMLNANKKFFAYALAPLVYNGAIIVGGFVSPYFGIQSVVWAVIIGASLHFLVQMPSVMALGYRYKFIFNPRDAGLRRVVALMVPRSISLGMTQLILIAFTRIGSLLPAGAVSIYSLTNNIQTTPIAIFAASIGTAVFPRLSGAASSDNATEYRKLLTDSLSGVLFFMIPSSILLWVLRAHIIRLYLALNHQTWEDTIRAIDTFGWFIIALVAQAVTLILIRAFYARHDTTRPMIISLISGASAIGLATYFTTIVRDVPALSLAFACAAWIEVTLLVTILLYRYPKSLHGRKLLESVSVSLLLAVLAGLLARITLSVVSEGLFITTGGLGTERVVPLFLALCAASGVGFGIYLIGSLLLRRKELLWIWPRRAVNNTPLPDSEHIATDEGLA